MPFKSEKQRKWMWANDPEMAKKWEKEEKMKRETKVRKLIKKIVRETMTEGFAGGLSKGKRKAFDNRRKKQSEVLGYTLTGKDDIKTEIDDATVTEGKLTEGKYDKILDKIEDLVKGANNFMGVGKVLKKAGIKYIFSTNMMPMYKLSKIPIAILNKKYVDKSDRTVGDIAIGVIGEGKLTEKAKRDYKDEYKKFQSSDNSKKYRAELNKYNRQKGTYGNGDGKDASHKGGKIVGFENESKNRGRREKSRLKKEQKLKEGSGSSKEAMGIAGFTGTRGVAVQDFIDKYELNAKKLFNFIKKGSLSQRLEFVSAIAGKPGNKIQKKIIKHFVENVDMDEQKIREMIQNIVVDEGFAGGLKKEDRKKFNKNRQKQSEVLGYELTGVDDLKTDIDDATIKEIRQLVEDIDEKFSFGDKLQKNIDKYNKNQQKNQEAVVRQQLLKKFGKDPLYKEFILAKNKKEQKKALDTLKSIRGPQAVKNLQKYAKKMMGESINESTEFIVFYNRKQHKVKAKDLYTAKKEFISKNKIPKSKQGIVAVMSKKAYDDQQFRYENINEAKFYDIPVAHLSKKKLNDLGIYLFNIVDLGLFTDMKLDKKKKMLSVNMSKISSKVAQNIQKRFDVDLNESKLNEGKKKFRVNLSAIGKAKYSIDFHDGKSKHKDGSPFWGIKIFKNKKDLEKAIKDYTKKGYIKESINEGGQGVLDKDQADVLQAIVMMNKKKSPKAILKIAMKDRMLARIPKQKLAKYIEEDLMMLNYM